MRRLTDAALVALLAAVLVGLGLLLTRQVHMLPLAGDRLAYLDLLRGVLLLLPVPLYLVLGQLTTRPRPRPTPRPAPRPAHPAAPARGAGATSP